MTIGIGEFSAGFNLFTGERKASSYINHDPAEMEKGLQIGRFGEKMPYGYVEEKGSRYRFGAAYVGWGNYRIGINSDRYVRHPIQNIGAHGIISPQPGFEVLSSGINPYLQYKTRNKFTSW